MLMTLTDAIKAAGAHPLSAPERRITLTGAASDSRETRRGDIFVCIRGERTDGHLFASAAVRAGAAAILA